MNDRNNVDSHLKHNNEPATQLKVVKSLSFAIVQLSDFSFTSLPFGLILEGITWTGYGKNVAVKAREIQTITPKFFDDVNGALESQMIQEFS